MGCRCDMHGQGKRCHCRTCCVTFSGPTAFDRHLAGTLAGGPHKSPGEAGLVEVYPRVWGQPDSGRRPPREAS